MKLRAAPLTLSALAGLAGCSPETTPIPVEALSQAGTSAFLCLGEPGDAPGLPITRCSRRASETPDDFGGEGGGSSGPLPHLYALVTQTSRGEIAVVDMTTKRSAIIDQDPGTPGASFLPVGARPVDVVASQGGTAAFVAVAEPGREGIFALPSAMVRPRAGCPAPTLSSWPACSLPAAPGEMLLVSDPPGPDGKLRTSCGAVEPSAPDGAGGSDAGEGGAGGNEPGEGGAGEGGAGGNDAGEGGAGGGSAGGDEPGEGGAGDACGVTRGDLDREGLGRQKLIVSLPDLGGFVVMDAQTLLEAEPGAFEECKIERWVPLQASPPPIAPTPEAPQGAACVDPGSPASAPQTLARPRPAGLAMAGDRLYIADLDAPVIHVVHMPTPCEPLELPPLLPTSVLEPGRAVTTSRLAVSPLTPPGARGGLPAFRRYLYAVDAADGSVMVFDISDGASRRTPLVREHAEWNPFQPADRIRLEAPVKDLVIARRDSPAEVPATGVAPEGIRCDPDPSLTVCDDSTTSCDVETLYRTSADYRSGAGPLKLRGSFAYMMLTNGRVAIVDVDDLDAACRGPRIESAVAGCDVASEPASGEELKTSGEASCNVVVPHTPRSQSYILPSEESSRREPGLQGFPVLHDRTGAIVRFSAAGPKMRATSPSWDPAPALSVAVGANRQPIAQVDAPETAGVDDRGLTLRAGELQHTLRMNLEDPRAHVVDQAWTVTYEGELPGFAQTRVAFGADGELRAPDARFCGRGVQSRESVKEQLVAAGLPEDEAAERAAERADFVQILSDVPPEDSKHWASADPAICDFDACSAVYGDVLTSRPELRVVEAFDDALTLESRSAERDEVAFARCCFAGTVELSVRAGSQWVVRGSISGFLHHVVADPETGVCRNSCDPRLARVNGRVVHTPADGPVAEGDPGAFINPMFRFAITGGDPAPERDMQFRFVTQGAFSPLVLNVNRSESAEFAPQSIRWIPATGELAITDGSLQGLIVLSASGLEVSRSFN